MFIFLLYTYQILLQTIITNIFFIVVITKSLNNQFYCFLKILKHTNAL